MCSSCSRAALGGLGQLVVEHELDVGIAVPHFHVGPVERLAIAAATPGFAEAEVCSPHLRRPVSLDEHRTKVGRSCFQGGIAALWRDEFEPLNDRETADLLARAPRDVRNAVIG